MLGNCYIPIAINYATKWVEAWTFRTNIVVVIAKFIYEHILTRFRCPLTIMTDQGTHFINDAIMYLTDHFIIRHTNLLFIIHKEMDKLSLQTKVLEPY
jgi:hypothetical protein